jgi:hypothetical protein
MGLCDGAWGLMEQGKRVLVACPGASQSDLEQVVCRLMRPSNLVRALLPKCIIHHPGGGFIHVAGRDDDVVGMVYDVVEGNPTPVMLSRVRP